jgi:hypothetical protein
MRVEESWYEEGYAEDATGNHGWPYQWPKLHQQDPPKTHCTNARHEISAGQCASAQSKDCAELPEGCTHPNIALTGQQSRSESDRAFLGPFAKESTDDHHPSPKDTIGHGGGEGVTVSEGISSNRKTPLVIMTTRTSPTESRYCVNHVDGHQRARKLPGQIFNKRYTVQGVPYGGGGVMVWGGVSSNR